MTILPPYAALLGLLFVALSVHTIRTRRRLGIALGDASQPEMLRAMRVHANFAEFVPLALVLLFLVEGNGAPAWAMHVLGAALVLARVAHAWGLGRQPEDFRLRGIGVGVTFGVLGVSALWLLIASLLR